MFGIIFVIMFGIMFGIMSGIIFGIIFGIMLGIMLGIAWGGRSLLELLPSVFPRVCPLERLIQHDDDQNVLGGFRNQGAGRRHTLRISPLASQVEL